MRSPKEEIRLNIALIFFILVFQLPAQTQWQKHPAPVLEVGSAGSWDETIAVTTTVIYHQGIYKMWYEGDSGFGHATSPDGLGWTKDTLHNPILEPGPPGSWDEMAVAIPNVIREGDLYKMWYGGFDGTYYQTGYATALLDNVEQSQNVLPASYRIFQNYPNPFNPTTVISWQLAVSSPVKLAVYDLSGKEVAVLVNEVKTTGIHQIAFDGSNLASGIYLYHLWTEKFSETRKMILMINLN